MPRPTRNSAWVVVPRCVEAGRGRRAFDRRDVDMGGQVLAPDVDVRVVVDAMAQVGTERAVAAPDRVVELGGGVAVVDEQEHAALETGRRVREPRTERQADLGALALGELDRLVGEPGGEVGRRRLGLDVDEGAVARPDEDLAQAAVADHDAVDRERVEDLVGEDEAGRPAPRCGRVGMSASPWPAASRRAAMASMPARLDLDRVVAQARREVRVLGGQAVEDRERERAGPGAVLAEDERLRPTEPVPGVRDRPGEGGPEDRVGLGGGQEVAVPTRAGGLGPVVAAIGVVQREVHEPREGDRPVARDLLVDPCHEVLVLPDRVEVGDGVAADARGHLHGVRPRRPAEHEPDARPDERVATEQDRDRRRRGRGA